MIFSPLSCRGPKLLIVKLSTSLLGRRRDSDGSAICSCSDVRPNTFQTLATFVVEVIMHGLVLVVLVSGGVNANQRNTAIDVV